MRKETIQITYSCDVCGKGIKSHEEVGIISIPEYYADKDDTVRVSREWHFHAGQAFDCHRKMVKVIDSKYTGQELS